MVKTAQMTFITDLQYRVHVAPIFIHPYMKVKANVTSPAAFVVVPGGRSKV